MQAWVFPRLTRENGENGKLCHHRLLVMMRTKISTDVTKNTNDVLYIYIYM